jgi:hypothetical protein
VKASLSSLILASKAYSGAEFAYFDAVATSGAIYAVEVVAPASERTISRKRPAEVRYNQNRR